MAVVLSIGDMIDLAIGSPEVGVVDFNMLQTVLFCLAQQLQVLNKNVEMRGIGMSVNPPSKDFISSVNITEYTVETDDTPPVELKPPEPEDKTMLVVERVKKTDSPTATEKTGVSTARLATESKPVSTARLATDGKPVSTPQDEQPKRGTAGPPSKKLSLVTVDKFQALENIVGDLRNRVYATIPRNEEILKEVTSQSNVNAIQDMWANVNVNSRLEAAEAGIAKLSSLVEDLLQEADMPIPVDNIRPDSHMPAVPEQSPEAKTAQAGSTPEAQATPTHDSDTKHKLKGELGRLETNVDRIRGDLDQLTQTFYSAMKEMQTRIDLPPPPSSIQPQSGTVPSDTAASDTAPSSKAPGDTKPSDTAPSGTAPSSKAPGDTKPSDTAPSGTAPSGTTPSGTAPSSKPPGDTAPSSKAPGGTAPSGTAPGVGGTTSPGSERSRPIKSLPSGSGTKEIIEKINDIERRLKECCDKVGGTEDSVPQQLESFQDQLECLSKEVANLSIAQGALSPELIKDLQGLMQLFQTVQDMQDQLKKVHETALQLAAEKDRRRSHTDALLEQIELLKTTKMDKEDVSQAMAEKADVNLLARKVSYGQFEIACENLSKGLDQALGKLDTQEALWQQALDDIQREIGMKLDKIELSPVKDFFNNKLKILQDSLKQMASLRRSVEAAGTKKKLLKDVKCISCDANAVMPMEATNVSSSKPMPASMSMKPYLTYELDKIRKTQASNLPQRNMHDWENIDKQMGQQPIPLRTSTGGEKHLCNRYCGGSHTTTTAAQRVARLGHFVKQWGPDVLPLSSGMATGDDGKLYKVSGVEAANVGTGGVINTLCTPKSPKKDVPQVTTEKPIYEECRCLEAAGRAK